MCTPLLLEGVSDVLYVYLPLKRHISGILQVDNGVPCAFSRFYFSPFQHWIDLHVLGHAILIHIFILPTMLLM
jgi:hypothetical protein